jgi:antitoxin component of RelBE/YafQ-DinJ toxin-antitoxin module
MKRNQTVLIRLTDKEKEKLKKYAENLGVSMSEVIQDYIKALPNKDC